MLVAAVIALFAGMTFPSILRMYRQHKITDSAERVRSAIAKTRIYAIEAGVAYQFCCEASGTQYAAVPTEADQIASHDGQQAAPAQPASRASGRLPAGVTFRSTVLNVSGAAVTPSTHKLSSASLNGLPNASELANANWSAPVLFNPDGSASADAEITVADNYSQIVKLHVRAFTGAVSMERLTQERR